jgi:CheY-like chemotaxis protein
MNDKISEPANGHCDILIVDDHPDAVAILSKLLRLEGHKVRVASDGMDALKTLSTFRPKVVILDLGMPKLDGYDTCSIIRNQPWGDDATIIALTANREEESRRQSERAGFDHYLVKPIEMASLRAIIAQAAA